MSAEMILNGTAGLMAPLTSATLTPLRLPEPGKLVKAHRLPFRPCVFRPGLLPARQACNARRWFPAPASRRSDSDAVPQTVLILRKAGAGNHLRALRSEEHTSELQSLAYLVCR